MVYIDKTKTKHAPFARRCNMLRPNFCQWLSSKGGMNLKSFCDVYVEIGGELQDILDALYKRQQEKEIL